MTPHPPVYHRHAAVSRFGDGWLINVPGESPRRVPSGSDEEAFLNEWAAVAALGSVCSEMRRFPQLGSHSDDIEVIMRAAFDDLISNLPEAHPVFCYKELPAIRGGSRLVFLSELFDESEGDEARIEERLSRGCDDLAFVWTDKAAIVERFIQDNSEAAAAAGWTFDGIRIDGVAAIYDDVCALAESVREGRWNDTPCFENIRHPFVRTVGTDEIMVRAEIAGRVREVRGASWSLQPLVRAFRTGRENLLRFERIASSAGLAG